MNSLHQLKEYFYQLVEYPTDINEHLFTLLDYAKHSDRVCELGARSGISTAALAVGLLRDQAYKRQLISVDIEDCSAVPAIKLARSCGLDMSFIQGDSVAVDLPEVDLLFIDSWHCYGHLKRELVKHHHAARRWIIMHDTEVYARTSDSVRMKSDLITLSEQSGYPIEEIYKGLSFAVSEFLQETPVWEVERVHNHNHGLTVLRRHAAI